MFNKPKVGFFSIGLDAYWGQYTGMKEHIERWQNDLILLISQYAEVVSAGMVDNAEKSKQAGERFVSEHVDIIFVNSSTYSTSSNLVHAVKTAGAPVILLNLQPVESLDYGKVSNVGQWLETCTCAGLPEMAAILIRNEIEFDVISGALYGDAEAERKIAEWCAAAQVKAVLGKTTIGMLGQAYEGMMDLYFDRAALLRQLGTDTMVVRYDELAAAIGRVTPEEIRKASKRILDAFLHDNMGEKDVESAAAVYAGIRRLVKEKALGAISFHYDGPADRGMQNVVATSNIAFSLLTTDGTPCCVEGDTRACAASLVAKILGGVCELTELYSMDFRDDVCIVGHSGSGDIGISAEKPVLRKTEVFHGKTGGGFLTQFTVRPGPVTLLALTQDAQERFRFVVAEGEIEKGEVLHLGDTNSRFRFEGGVRRFVNEWTKQGPSHHCVMMPGHCASRIEKAAKVLRLPAHTIK